MTEEMFLQGDMERKLGFVPRHENDRSVANPFVYWKGYLDVVVEPLLELWTSFLPELADDMLEKGLSVNRKEVEEKM